MPGAGDLLIVHMVQPQPIGGYFDRSRWPLHITLMQWFSPQVPLDVLRKELVTATQRISPFDVTVGAEALFGAEQNIPVNVIADQTAIKELHQVLLAVLRQLGLKVNDDQWVGDKYTAHITHQSETIRPHEHDVVRVDTLHLVRLLNEQTCEIVAECNLTGSNNV